MSDIDESIKSDLIVVLHQYPFFKNLIILVDLASPAVQLADQVPSCQGEQPDVGKALNMLFGIYLFGQCIANALQCLELYIYLAIPVVSPTKRELESQATE